jgi:preprotein translocase subunit SecE
MSKEKALPPKGWVEPLPASQAKKAKEKTATAGGFRQLLGELFKTEVYKRSQGRIVRQITCLAVWVTFALAAWRMLVFLRVFGAGIVQTVLGPEIQSSSALVMSLVYGLPTVVLFFGIWLGYRLVNLPSFADFLIAVEAEMNKVSWPSRTELIRSSMVVIILMFGLTAVLFSYDLILRWFLSDVLGITA